MKPICGLKWLGILASTAATGIWLLGEDVKSPQKDPLLKMGYSCTYPVETPAEALCLFNDAYGVPISAEFYEGDRRIHIILQVTEDMTLRSALRKVCQQMGPTKGYKVVKDSVTGMTMLIPVMRIKKDVSYPLLRRIPEFTVRHKTVKEVYDKLVQMSFTQPSSGIISTSPRAKFRYPLYYDTRPTDISISATNVTLRELLNRVVIQMTNAYWYADISGTNCYLQICWIVPSSLQTPPELPNVATPVISPQQ